MTPYYDLEFGSRLMNLLHLGRATPQTPNRNAYEGKRAYITAEDFTAHLNDETLTPYGFCVINKGRAGFLCLDFDSLVKPRMEVARRVLERRGMLGASFKTNGSDPDRGKVIVTLAHPMPQAQAVETINEIFEECCSHPEFGGPDKVDRRPQAGEGGLLRVLGRNVIKNGPLEIMTDWEDRLITDLDTITPYRFTKVPVKIEGPSLNPDVFGYRHNGIRRDTAHGRILTICNFLANEALKVYDFAAAEHHLSKWLDEIAEASPEIMNGDTTKKSLLQCSQALYYLNGAYKMRQRVYAWREIHFVPMETKRTKFLKYAIHMPLNPLEAFVEGRREYLAGYVSQGVVKLYRTLVAYCRKKQITMDRISIDAETLSDYLGLEERQTRRLIQEAINNDLLLLISGGEYKPGVRRTNVYKLVSEDEYDQRHRTNVPLLKEEDILEAGHLLNPTPVPEESAV